MTDRKDKAAKIGWLQTWSLRYLRKPSVIALILANLIPLYGVIFWNWDLLTLMMAYWLETGVIGFWTILHLGLAVRWLALFTVPFFVVHFGGFMFGHLLFLWTLFADDADKKANQIEDMLHLVPEFLMRNWLWVALIALFVSHGVSFVINVLMPWWRGRLEQSTRGDVMMSPYGRIVIMHITLIIGAGLVAYFGTKTAAFVLLIALKLLVDVPIHVRKNFAAEPDPVRGLSTA
jgi:hypothetical protein